MRTVLVVGLGSMGKRRIRLMKQLDPTIRVLGVDSSSERVAEANELFGVQACASIEDAVNEGASCAFVCASPLAHREIILQCLDCGLHVFTELNVVSDGYDEMMESAKRANKALFLSSTFLYRSEIRYVRRRVEEVGKACAYFYHVGQYLPDWHPWEKIQDFFVFDRRTNGVREILVRELPWLTETFGEIVRFDVIGGSISSLPLSYPDSYFMLFEHSSGTKGAVLMDVVARKSVINLEVFNEDLYVSWGGTPETLVERDIDSGEDIAAGSDFDYVHQEGYSPTIAENAYTAEIVAFFDLVDNGVSPQYGFAEDKKVLDVMDAIERELGIEQ